jgi:phage shock protein A
MQRVSRELWARTLRGTRKVNTKNHYCKFWHYCTRIKKNLSKLSNQIKEENSRLATAIQECRNETARQARAFQHAMEELLDKLYRKLERSIAESNTRAENLAARLDAKDKQLSGSTVTTRTELDQERELVRQEVGHIRQSETEENQSIRDQTGKQIEQLNSGLGRVKREASQKVAEIRAQVTELRYQLIQTNAEREGIPAEPNSTHATPNHRSSAVIENPPSTQPSVIEQPRVLHGRTESVKEIGAACNQNTERMDEVIVNEPALTPLHVGAQVNYLTASEIPLSLFETGNDQNPVRHTQELDEYFALKSVPKHLRLAIATRSLKCPSSRDWALATSKTWNSYEDFKSAFIKQFWGSDCQSTVRCSMYQGRYNKHDKRNMANHFLKFAVLARFLNPPMESEELFLR